MGILARQGFINTVIIYSGFCLGYVNIALLMPKFFSTGQIGARETIISFALILSQIGLFGLPGAFTKFFHKYRKLSHFGLLETFLVLTIIIFSIILLGFYLLSPFFKEALFDTSPITYQYFNLIYLLGFFLVIHSLLDVFYRNLLLSFVPNFLKEFFQRLVTTALILLYSFQLINFSTFINAFCWSFALNTLAMIYYLYFKNHIRLRLSSRLFKIIKFSETFNFAAFSLITSTAGMFVIQIDKIMLSSSINEETTGIYTLGVYLATLIEAPKRAISQTSSPLIAKAWGENNINEVTKISRLTSLGQQLIGSLLFILLWTSINDIYSIIPKDAIYSSGKWVVLFIGITKVIGMAFGTTNESLAYSPKFRSNLIFAIATLIVTIITNLILIPELGMFGAAIASLISLTAVLLVKFFFVRYHFNINCFSKKNILVLLLTLLSLTIGHFIPNFESAYLNIFYKSSVIFLTFLLPIYFFKISPEFNGVVHKYLLRKK